jgi:hypothetical protein
MGLCLPLHSWMISCLAPLPFNDEHGMEKEFA